MQCFEAASLVLVLQLVIMDETFSALVLIIFRVVDPYLLLTGTYLLLEGR
jgi:hypothetical protein